MHLTRFKYFRLSSRAEAARLLKEHGKCARLVAGGTDLYPRMKYGLTCPEVVISLKDADIKSPEVDESGNLHIDPLMTLADVVRSPVIRSKFPILADAAHCVASHQIRNMATLGGNICLENRCLYFNQSHSFQFVAPCFKRDGDICYHFPKGKKCLAVFVADTVPVLISLGAITTFTDGVNIRSLILEELYTGDALRPLDLNEGDILTEIVIPVQESPYKMGFSKFSLRGGVEFAALNVAVAVKMDNSKGACGEARLTAGAISQAPVRLKKAEAAIIGRLPTEDLFEDVAHLAIDEVSALPHHGYSATYLKECLKVITKRVLADAFLFNETQEAII